MEAREYKQEILTKIRNFKFIPEEMKRSLNNLENIVENVTIENNIPYLEDNFNINFNLLDSFQIELGKLLNIFAGFKTLEKNASDFNFKNKAKNADVVLGAYFKTMKANISVEIKKFINQLIASDYKIGAFATVEENELNSKEYTITMEVYSALKNESIDFQWEFEIEKGCTYSESLKQAFIEGFLRFVKNWNCACDKEDRLNSNNIFLISAEESLSKAINLFALQNEINKINKEIDDKKEEINNKVDKALKDLDKIIDDPDEMAKKFKELIKDIIGDDPNIQLIDDDGDGDDTKWTIQKR